MDPRPPVFDTAAAHVGEGAGLIEGAEGAAVAVGGEGEGALVGEEHAAVHGEGHP